VTEHPGHTDDCVVDDTISADDGRCTTVSELQPRTCIVLSILAI